MCEPISMGTALLAGSLAGTAATLYSGNKQRKEAKAAQAQAAAEADQAFNRANQKKPNVAAMAADNMAAGGLGGASTLLTGAQGADPAAFLGRKTLLGG